MSLTNKQSTTMKTIDKFMELYRLSKDSNVTTHTSFKGGKFYIRGSDLETFFKHYIRDYENNVPLHYTEMTRNIQPVCIDLDFRFNDTDDIKRRYNMVHIKQFLKIFHSEMSKIIRMTGREQYIILEKETAVYDKDKNVVKDGIHIVCPDVVTYWSGILEARNRTVEELKNTDWKDIIGFSNEIEDVFDERVIGPKANPWIMYGSRNPKKAMYNVTHHWNSNFEDTPLLNNVEYIQLLSIRNKFMKSEYVSDEIGEKYDKIYADWEEDYIIRKKQQLETASKKISKTHTPLSSSEMSDLEQAVMLLNKRRADDYGAWSEVVWCISSICGKSKEGLEIALNFSRQSPKFNETSVIEFYTNEDNSGRLRMGTVMYWLKEDGKLKEYKPKTLYSDIELIDKFIDDGFDMNDKDDVYKMITMTQAIPRSQNVEITDYNVALLLKIVANKKIVSVVEGSKTIYYVFKGHRWVRRNSDSEIRTLINRTLVTVLALYNTIIGDKMLDAIKRRDEQDEEYYMSITRKIMKLVEKCHSSKYKSNIISEFNVLVEKQTSEFTEKLDENPYLIGFEDGVYDLKTSEFREGRPEDLLTYSVGYDYPREFDTEKQLEIKTFLIDIMPADTDEDILKLEENPNHWGKNRLNAYHLFYTVALCLQGSNVREKMHIWTGRGGNGKGLFSELIKHAFGDYHYAPDVSILTTKRKDASGAQSELDKGKGRRFCLMTEPDQTDTIKASKAKQYSGNDLIQTRGLYKDACEWKPQFTMFLQCNNIPNLSGCDGGMERRLEILEFPWLFKDDPDPTKPKHKPYTFGPDVDVKQKFAEDGYGSQFMLLLLEFYENHIKGNNPQKYKPPENVNLYTKKYMEQQDTIGLFIEEHCVQPKEGETWKINECTKISEFYIEYKRVYGNDAIAKGLFRDQMLDLGYEVGKSESNKRWKYIKLLKDCHDNIEDNGEDDEDYHEMMMKKSITN
jgi:phage/plasmid-associated DNA primase